MGRAKVAIGSRGWDRIRSLSIETRILVIVLLAGFCIVATGATALSQLSSVRYSGQEEGTQAVVETAAGTISTSKALSKPGL